VADLLAAKRLGIGTGATFATIYDVAAGRSTSRCTDGSARRSSEGDDHLAVDVSGALQLDGGAGLLDRERGGDRHDEFPGDRRGDALERPRRRVPAAGGARAVRRAGRRDRRDPAWRDPEF
jgi:hypothetical protein